MIWLIRQKGGIKSHIGELTHSSKLHQRVYNITQVLTEYILIWHIQSTVYKMVINKLQITFYY